ncbi:cytochrome c3 family protein [Labilithrix luteola]|nr:cytochrome c3 family protein [Labilithrix luteola]
MNASRLRRIGLALALVVAALLFVRFVLWPARKPPLSPVEFVPKTWETARQSPMHALHVGKREIACTRCHQKGFDEPPSTTACAQSDCHAKAAANAHVGNATTKTDCLACHVFKGDTQAAACVDCHGTGKANGHAHHATSGVACTTCHDPHGEKGARLRTADCTSCHTTVSALHGRMEAHAGMPSGSTAMCTNCHLPHQGKEEARARCTTCHVDGNVTADAPRIELGAKRHPACVTCHEPHDVRKADVKACAGCHQDRTQALATPEHAGHASCTNCHRPHAPEGAAATCKGCHADKNTLGASHVTAHAECTSCHDPHRPAASKEAACVQCHQAIEPKHPQARACIGCHAPHPANREAPIAAACSSCHTKASSDHAFHTAKTTCRDCHAPHAFALASVKPEPVAKAGLVTASGQFCGRCHAAEKNAVRQGHSACTACHGEPHAPNRSPSCAACHANEASSAPKGHATCTKCHDGHSGSLGNHAACTSCHTDKAKAQHGSLQTGCQTCHRPHGPNGVATPPACTTCHSPAKLPGLHKITEHAAKCTNCHSSHGPPRSDRATCTSSCHTDRRSHQPSADVCKGCHIFR